MRPTLGTDPRAGSVRGVRAAVLTAPAVTVSVLAHHLAGGCVTASGVAVAMGVVWPLMVWVLGRRRSALGLGVALACGQALVHGVLDAVCWGDAGVHRPLGASSPMLAWHVLAALVCGVVLSRADSGLWLAHGLLRAARRLRRPVTSYLVVPQVPPRLSPTSFPRALVGRSVDPEQVLRGPPAALAR